MRWRAVFPLLALLFALLAAGCGARLIGNPSSGDSENADAPGTAEAETTVYGKTQPDNPKTTSRADARPATASSGTAGSRNTRDGSRSSASEGRADGARPGPVSDAPVPKKGGSGVPFGDSAHASGGAGSEADSILAVRYGAHKDFERVVVDLGAGKLPAKSVPEWTLNSPVGDGLLRITFPSVSATRASDGQLGGSLVRSFHVVRAPEDGMFIDISSGAAFTYRVLELSTPARLVVDFKPSPDSSLQVPLPAKSGNTVLVEPRAKASVGDPLIVSGYSRNPEALNTIILKGPDGKTLIRDSVPSNDWSSTWGYFETTLAPPLFSGEATLMVGAESPRDGSFQGVEVPVSGG